MEMVMQDEGRKIIVQENEIQNSAESGVEARSSAANV
jgi:hypothetical protein